MTIQEIRDNNKRARLAMLRARQQKYALVAFNIDDQSTLKSVAKILKELKAPAMIEVSQGEVDAMGLQNIRDLVDNYKQEYDIELYINLDHSPSIQAAKAAIDCGYEFIHIDISQANKKAKLSEIISATKEVVEYAKFLGANVESEPHYFSGSSNMHKEGIDYEEIKKDFTTPSVAANFVKSTGIDTFAVAIGNLHGSYPVPKILDIKLLKEIRKATDCNLSLHGGSGTPAEFYGQAVKAGISKVNINSDIRIAYRNALEQALKDNPDEFAVLKLMDQVHAAIEAVMAEKLHLMGSVGKAIV